MVKIAVSYFVLGSNVGFIEIYRSHEDNTTQWDYKSAYGS